MDPWRLLGRAILVATDVLAAGTVAGLTAFFATPIVWVDDRVWAALTVGGAVAGVTLAVALALAGRGHRPFPATRLATVAWRRLWWL